MASYTFRPLANPCRRKIGHVQLSWPFKHKSFPTLPPIKRCIFSIGLVESRLQAFFGHVHLLHRLINIVQKNGSQHLQACCHGRLCGEFGRTHALLAYMELTPAPPPSSTERELLGLSIAERLRVQRTSTDTRWVPGRLVRIQGGVSELGFETVLARGLQTAWDEKVWTRSSISVG